MELTTTLNEILKHNPCNQSTGDPHDSGWNCLIDYLGLSFDRDEEINLLTILESNGVEDCLWALRATMQNSKMISVQLAIAFAERVLHIYEGKHPDNDAPRNAIEAAKKWVNNPTEETRRNASNAAVYAAADAYATYDAYAADAAHAAYAAAYADAADAADYAADADAAADNAMDERKAQAEIVKRMLK